MASTLPYFNFSQELRHLTTDQQCEAEFASLQGGVYGFDLEHDPQENIVAIQLCAKSKVWVTEISACSSL